MTTQAKHVMSVNTGGSWTLAPNDIWNIPKGIGTIARDTYASRFEMKFSGQYGFQQVTSLRGLLIGLDGEVYGVRTLSSPKQEGYQMHGRVSVGGKKRRAFTSTRLFERTDGTLCDVDVLVLIRD